ncbi:MAG: hypothetical protein ACKO96_32575, partial [Flammeovirgaceae bacterium]
PHLHFGLYTKLYSTTVDPTPYLQQAKKPSYFNLPEPPTVIGKDPNEPINNFAQKWNNKLKPFWADDGNTFGTLRSRWYNGDVESVLNSFGQEIERLNLIIESKPQPEAISTSAQPTMPTISVKNPVIFTDPVQPTLPEPKTESILVNPEDAQTPKSEVLDTKNITLKYETKVEAEKFDLNKFFVGVFSGKNPLTNSVFFVGLAGVYAFYNQNQEQINLALGLIGEGVAILYPLVRKYLENQKV